MFGRKTIQTLKEGFGRGAQFLRREAQNLPKYIKKGLEIAGSANQTIQKTGAVAGKLKDIADKNNLVPEASKGKVNSGFNKGFQAIRDINDANSKLQNVGNQVLGSGIF
jgi:hypothetical protein